MSVEVSSQSEFLTVDQVAARYSVSKDTIWRWKREGMFPKACVVGKGTTRWRLRDLVEHEATFEACFVHRIEM